MYTITKEFHFSASHQLKDLPENHQCSRLHGHNYILKINLRSVKLNDVGFVRDYGELSDIKKYVDDNLDHRHLNNVFHFNPTSELICKYIFNKFIHKYPELYSVELSETPKTNCIYSQSKSSGGIF